MSWIRMSSLRYQLEQEGPGFDFENLHIVIVVESKA